MNVDFLFASLFNSILTHLSAMFTILLVFCLCYPQICHEIETDHRTLPVK